MQQRFTGSFNLCGYNAVYRCRAVTRGGGVDIFVHKTLNHVKLPILPKCAYDILTLDVKRGCQNFYVNAGYNPRLTLLDEFCIQLEYSLNKLKNQPVYLLGDFNVDPVRDYRAYSPMRDLIAAYGFYLCNRIFPTRTVNSTTGLLDHIYTNNKVGRFNVFNIDKIFSDHNLLLFIVHDLQSNDTYTWYTCSKTNHVELARYFDRNPFTCDVPCSETYYTELQNYVKIRLQACIKTRMIYKKKN